MRLLHVLILVVLGLFMFVGSFYLIFIKLDKHACEQKYKDSGMAYRFNGLFGGCQLSKDGTIWIPARAYHVVKDNNGN